MKKKKESIFCGLTKDPSGFKVGMIVWCITALLFAGITVFYSLRSMSIADSDRYIRMNVVFADAEKKETLRSQIVLLSDSNGNRYVIDDCYTVLQGEEKLLKGIASGREYSIVVIPEENKYRVLALEDEHHTYVQLNRVVDNEVESITGLVWASVVICSVCAAYMLFILYAATHRDRFSEKTLRLMFNGKGLKDEEWEKIKLNQKD